MSDFEDNQFQDDNQGFDEDNPDNQSDEEEPEGEDIQQENNDDDDEEEDDQGPNEYEKDDFIVDEDEEQQDEPEEDRKVRRRKRRREQQIMDEDDINLLQEHGQRVPRHLLKQNRRIKKKGQDEGQKRSAVQQLEETLFGGAQQFDDLQQDGRGQGDQDDFIEEDNVQEQDDVERDSFVDDEDDEMADFIDYDEPNQQAEEVIGDGQQQQTQRRPKNRRKLFSGLKGVGYQAMKEAAQIMGDVDSVLEQYYAKKQQQNMEQEDEGQEYDQDVRDQQALGNISREQLRQIKKVSQIDPTVIFRQYLTPEDMLIRTMDIPERHLLRYQKLLQFDEKNIEDSFLTFDTIGCAGWIYESLFSPSAFNRVEKQLLEQGILEVQGTPTDGRQAWDDDELEGVGADVDKIYIGFRMVRKIRTEEKIRKWRDNQQAQDNIIESIEEVLKLMYHKSYEVPYIAAYFKDQCGELLAMFEEDKPQVTTQEEAKQSNLDNEQTLQIGSVQPHHRKIKRYSILWTIWEYSIKYWQFIKRKEKLQQKLDRLFNSTENQSSERSTVYQYVRQLKDTKSTLDLDVLAHKIRIFQSTQDISNQLSNLDIHNNGTLNGAPTHKQKRPQSTTPKEVQRFKVLQQIYDLQLLLSADKFHENVQYGFAKNDLEDSIGQQSLDETLTEFIDDTLGWSDLTLLKKGVKEMASLDLQSDTLIREEVRNFYLTYGYMDTDLVNQDDDRLFDAFHPLCIAKRIRGKPLRTFQDSDLILKIQRGQQQKLISYNIYFDQKDKEDFLKKHIDLYQSTGASTRSEDANKFRREILKDAITNRIMPLAEKEVMGQLLGLAKEHLSHNIADSMWKYTSQPPFKLRSRFEEEGFIDQLRLLVCSWSDGRPPTTFVMLDPQGMPVDFLRCQNLSGSVLKPQAFELNKTSEGQNYQYSAGVIEDVERVKSFIMQHAPHAIVVAASGMESRNLKEGLQKLKNYFLAELPDFLRNKLPEVPNIWVDFADDKLPQIWSDCRLARDEFPEYDLILRKCIGLGRWLIDPLSIVTSLCGPHREINALQLNALQDMLTPDERFKIIEQIVISSVCQVGLDINSMLQVQWMQSNLQFVGGLGPRKVDRLIQQLKHSQNRLQYRKDLFAYGYLTAVVATNSVGFLRVQQGHLSNNYMLDNTEFDPLDDTRIHPLDYELAKKIANSALKDKYKGEDQEEYEDQAVADAFQEQQLVQELDMGWYNKQLMEEMDVDQSILAKLLDIQMEFVQPYGEVRTGNIELTAENLFYQLTGEAKESLKEGRLVNCYIYRVEQQQANISVPDLKIEGTIDIDNVSDRRPQNMNEKIRPKMSFQARILDFDYEKFLVRLSCKTSDLRDYDRWEYRYCQKQEPFFHILNDEERNQIKEEKKKQNSQKKPQLKHRPISHPMFKNVTFTDALAYLDKERDGSVIFRPHKYSEMQLSFTLKLHTSSHYGHIYLNQNIEEVKKASGPKAQLAIGRPLLISVLGQTNKEEFDDLDEILARYIDPYMSYIKTITKHPKYRDGSKAELDRDLQERLKANPSTALWCLGLEPAHPGYYLIAFISSSGRGNVHHEVFAITPHGFYFRQKVYERFDQVIARFKQEPYAPQRDHLKAMSHLGHTSKVYDTNSDISTTTVQQQYDDFVPPPPPLPPAQATEAEAVVMGEEEW